MPNKSDIGQRYLEHLNNQEDKLETMVAQRTKLEIEKSTQLEKLQDFIAGIKV